MTDRTSMSILLNSSKQAQAPVYDSPVNSFSIILTLTYSLQLKTIQYLPRTLARSLQLSVFPVPAGPVGLAPFHKYILFIILISFI